MKGVRYIMILSVLMATACVYTYEASVPENVKAVLVVEGDIIVNGVTHIRLSQTTPLQESRLSVVSGARVYIEGEQGGRYPLPEIASGQYEAETSHLDPQQRYRLHLSLENQKQYASSYVPVVVSPPIDSVGYTLYNDATALAIHVSTHDALAQTNYYRWSYVETWEITSPLLSNVKYDTGTMTYSIREYEENLHHCWANQKSAGILLGNTTRLAADVINKQVLLHIPERDMRVGNLYCIQITQMALTKEAYLYWENLRKNSEDIGGLFSPQPSEVQGNIFCLDQPDEPVIGYIAAGTQALSERKYIPSGLMKGVIWPVCTCEEDIGSLSITDYVSPLRYIRNGWMPMWYNDTMSAVYWHLPGCGDCRTWGGTKERPAWWPNNHI